jgi:transposase-like protein
MEQRYKENYYELMDGCDFPKAYVAELGQLNMNSNELLKTAATGGGFALAAVAGVPAAVTSAVGALAAASTGTAISSLSGAAATNAVMAWLGGGAIAAGGGGMAAGAVVLAGITYTVTGVVALAATGLVASSVFAKKLTQAQKYSSEVDIACEKMKTSWAAMEGIKQRVNELMEVTMNVYDKCIIQLAQLEPVISCFDTKSKEHILIFQKTALLVKSISELAKTPLFGDDMNLSGESEAIITRTRKILNTEL